MLKYRLKKYALAIFILIFNFTILSIISAQSYFNSYDKLVKGSLITPKKTVNDQKTAFEDMTVPYLRNRDYTGKIQGREVLSENDLYTSYLTSYSSDGLKINALLTIPKTEAPKDGFSAVVFVHGYIPPGTYETNGQSYSKYVDYLASRGLVVFKIDLRGHGESQGVAGGGYYGSDYVVDTLNAYNALQTSGLVNPKKIGLWGHSMAGNILLRCAVIKKDIPAVVIWAGAVYSYTDQQKYGINDSSFRPSGITSKQMERRKRIFEKYGRPSAGSPFWQKVAPTTFLPDLKGAIQIHHAQDDNVVNIGYSRDLVKLLDKTSVKNEYFEYQSGGHNISGESFDQAMQRTVDFYKKYL